jgi:hypothetical protein
VSVPSYPVGGVVENVAIAAGTESFNEALGTTNGQPNQTFQLKNANLIDGTLELSIGAVSYTLVPNAIVAAPTDTDYTIETDENGITTITVGDGINGVIPPRNQAVTATYYYGGGADTNVSAGTITTLSGMANGAPVPPQILSCTNPSGATGGGDEQTLANAQANLPLSLKANNRGVTAQDYASLAVANVPGVFQANAVAGVAYGGSSPILLFVVPNGGGNPSAVLINQIQIALANLKLAGKRIRVLPPVYVNLVIDADLFVQPNSVALTVSNSLRTLLDAKYALTAVTFGQVFALQDLYDTTQSTDVQGLSRVFYGQFTIQPYFARHVNKPTTGNGDVEGIMVDTETVQRREWLIRVIGPNPPVFCNRFQVWQRQLGTISAVTDTLMTDQTGNYTPNALSTEVDSIGPWFLRPNPELNSGPSSTEPSSSGSAVTFAITANTTTSISVVGGLLVNAEPNDPYVVEALEPTIGKILRTTTTAAVSAATVLPVVSSTSFQAGDPVRVWQGTTAFVTSVVSVGAGVINVAEPCTFPTSGAFVDYLWISEDGTVQFSVIDGPAVSPPPTLPTSFIVGDELYVDTYPAAGDLVLRPENFPLISDANLSISPIGGVQ